MKKLFLALLATLALTNCSKDNNDLPSNPADQLPPATTIGANKVGCLVNGEVYLPKGSNPFGAPLVTCYYQYVNYGFEFGLGFTNNSIGLRGITILSNKLEFVQGQTYIIKNEQTENSVYAFFTLENNQGYRTTESFVGTLKITKLDLISNIISGTFSFDAIKINSGEVIQIREGRFDMQYSP